MRIPFPALDSLWHIFVNESTAIDWLTRNRCVDILIECPECGSNIRLEGKLFHCCSRKCRKSISVFNNSFFSKVKIPINKLLQLGYFWLGGSGRDEIVRFTGCVDKTVTNYMRYFRQLVISSLDSDDIMVGGEGVEVELDESKFGKRKYHRGHRVDGAWVFGGVERTPERKVFAEVVNDRSAATLLEIISRHVLPGTILLTDCWRGYANLSNEGFLHHNVNHSITFVSESGVHTNTIEGTWNGIKMKIPPRNRTRDELPDLLLEQVWRRKNMEDLWGGLIRSFQIVAYD
jgi:transposase-like protein